MSLSPPTGQKTLFVSGRGQRQGRGRELRRTQAQGSLGPWNHGRTVRFPKAPACAAVGTGVCACFPVKGQRAVTEALQPLLPRGRRCSVTRPTGAPGARGSVPREARCTGACHVPSPTLGHRFPCNTETALCVENVKGRMDREGRASRNPFSCTWPAAHRNATPLWAFGFAEPPAPAWESI